MVDKGETNLIEVEAGMAAVVCFSCAGVCWANCRRRGSPRALLPVVDPRKKNELSDTSPLPFHHHHQPCPPGVHEDAGRTPADCASAWLPAAEEDAPLRPALAPLHRTFDKRFSALGRSSARVLDVMGVLARSSASGISSTRDGTHEGQGFI